MKIKFRFADGEVEADAYDQLNLLAHAQMIERSLQSKCGGQCECSTCRVRLVSGSLSPMREPERALLEQVGALDGQTRLACQCFPASRDIVIEVPNERFKDARYTK